MKERLLVAIGVMAAMAMGTRVVDAQAPLLAAPATAQAGPAAPPGDAARGRKLFVSFGCYQCHGFEAQGSSATGPRLGPRPMAFAAFSRYVRRPTNQMPPFAVKVVTDGELADIYAFLRSLPPPREADGIALLK